MSINRKNYETPMIVTLVYRADDVVRTSIQNNQEFIGNFNGSWITGMTTNNGDE